MKCEQVRNALPILLAGRASREERGRLDAHLASCAGCARHADQMRSVWLALDELPGTEPSAGFDARFRARLAAQPARSPLLAWFPMPVRLAAAALVVAVIAAWFSLRPITGKRVATRAQAQDDFAVVKNLTVLENYDVISNFDALSALPGAEAAPRRME
ncbi:MAG TPA: zf-HC2 domain-containing protein [Candidatus Acidoferrales bacterium]|nr:zf-HC2 domain-containing protein [Candidatus Acidoferrales bacterium]